LKRILFFSNNENKVKEIKNLFNDFNISVLSLNDFNINISPKENGRSFSENAKIKSIFGYRKTNIPSFADDSGICIEALKWKPDITSKRFIQGFKKSSDCFKYIIDKVNKTGKNKAYFQTSICYTLKNNYHIVFEGRVWGTISRKIMGVRGFGFDPIFIPSGYKKTFGQMTIHEKNLISHRSIATNKFLGFLIN